MVHQDIVSHFFPYSKIKDVHEFGNGHINDTYKVIIEEDPQAYILQKVNTNVFKNIPGIIKNHFRLQEFLNRGQSTIKIPYLIKAKDKSYFFRDQSGFIWRMMNFIQNSYSIEQVEHSWQAREAGKSFGHFASICSTLNPIDFEEAIPDFHKLSFRLNQLKQAIQNNVAKRLSLVEEITTFFMDREAKLMRLEDLINSGQIPTRIVHNDTKINNLLFQDKKAIAVIDLDTLGPGCIFYDYGDAIRTIANSSVEDEKDLSLVKFNLDYFLPFSESYLSELRDDLCYEEKENIYLAPILMTYIMGIRFLADYLNGDTYYKTKYNDHNLVRSKVQKKLIESMENSERYIVKSIKEIL